MGYDSSLRTWSAFLSDHAVLAFALATGFWLVSRPTGIFACIHSALIICMPRMYYGLHHPSGLLLQQMVVLFNNLRAAIALLMKLLRSVVA
jgi:uncharacterized membrane protein (DUF2068 family)